MNLTKASAVTGVRKNKQGMVTAFNIIRKNWGRGDRGGYLFKFVKVELTKQVNRIDMCCLGIYGRACGISVAKLNRKSMPSNVIGRIPKSFKLVLDINENDTALADELAGINDDLNSTDGFKEQQIIARFAKIGVKVRFVGKG